MIIQTKRLILRPFCDDDKEWYYGMTRNEDVKRRLKGLRARNRKKANKDVDLLKAANFIDDFYFVITDKEENILGIIIAIRITYQVIDVSYFLFPKYRHNGYMYEALDCFVKEIKLKVCDYSFRMVVDEDNRASMNLMRKFEGMTYIDSKGRYVFYIY